MLEGSRVLEFAALARPIPLSYQISEILQTGSAVVRQILVATIQTGTRRDVREYESLREYSTVPTVGGTVLYFTRPVYLVLPE